jgi:hypothetical protein
VRSRSQHFVERLLPIFYRLIVHFHNDMPDNRRSDSFVGHGKVNGGAVAAIELENWPHRRAHLLALHVSGVTGNAKSQESNNGRDHYVESARATRLLLFRHGADHIAGELSVYTKTVNASVSL